MSLNNCKVRRTCNNICKMRIFASLFRMHLFREFALNPRNVNENRPILFSCYSHLRNDIIIFMIILLNVFIYSITAIL